MRLKGNMQERNCYVRLMLFSHINSSPSELLFASLNHPLSSFLNCYKRKMHARKTSLGTIIDGTRYKFSLSATHWMATECVESGAYTGVLSIEFTCRLEDGMVGTYFEDYSGRTREGRMQISHCSRSSVRGRGHYQIGSKEQPHWGIEVVVADSSRYEGLPCNSWLAKASYDSHPIKAGCNKIHGLAMAGIKGRTMTNALP